MTAEQIAFVCGYAEKTAAEKGYSGVSFQQYLPTQARRELSEDEKQEIERARGGWIEPVIRTSATSLSRLQASPRKQALIGILIGGGAGALVGGAVGARMKPGDAQDAEIDMKNIGIGAGVGAGLGGTLGGILFYLARRKRNEEMEEMLRRSLPGATLRDYMADPVVQANMERASRMAASQSHAGILGASLVGL